jgi:DNA-binding transcriptional regulator YdaS (Cro superfamily)
MTCYLDDDLDQDLLFSLGIRGCNMGQIPCKEGADIISADTKSVIERAKRIYAEQLRAMLEPRHLNRFVAIEPESGEHFLGDAFDEAVKLARLSRTLIFANLR